LPQGAEGRRVAIVTGAAGGIGQSVAVALAADGFAVIPADISGEGAKATALTITQMGGEAIGLGVDVRRRSSLAELVDATLNRYGRLDVLVNNAGIIDYAPVLDLTEDAWDRILGVNLKGAFLCSQLAAAAMVARRIAGVIVNVTSISAELPEPDCIHYGVSKAGLAYLTRTLALALAPRGIRVVAVAPGTIRTPMNSDLLRDPTLVDARLATIPLRRLGAPPDIAGAVSFLVSDAASYVTGSTLYVEGGMMLVR
jgi:NAD(P)-dependent dehydrogenase (short-subunit alcohol dehydrogenase family)